jgi:hypothetical protein
MGFLSNLKSKISKFDLMTDSPNLRIEGKKSYQTTVGGCMNLIVIILSFIGTIYFGLQMINKTEPIVVQSSMDGHQVGPYNISKEGFNVLIGIEFPNWTYYMNDRIYTVEGEVGTNYFNSIGKVQSYTKEKIECAPCSKYYTQDELNVELSINNFWCFAPNITSVESYWGNKMARVVTFSIYKCVNTTLNNNHCLPENEINELTQGGMVSMFTTNAFLNLNDPNKPVENKLQNWWNSINLDFTYEYYYVLKELQFEDDTGFLLPNQHISSHFYFENPLILYYGKRGSLLATIHVEGHRFGTRIKRSYAKIQDVLTRIGGLLKALSIVASLIANVTSEIEFYADSLFNFKFQLANTKNVELNKFLSNMQQYVGIPEVFQGLKKSLKVNFIQY